MESVGVKNADAEAALPALRDCDGSCPGLGSRALAPALPSCSRANYFAISSSFPLSLPCLWNEKFGDTQRRQIGFILPELSLKASLRALHRGGFWNRIWGHRRLWWFVLFISLPGLRDAQIAACTVHMFLWWDTRDKLALQREELGLAYSWGDSKAHRTILLHELMGVSMDIPYSFPRAHLQVNQSLLILLNSPKVQSSPHQDHYLSNQVPNTRILKPLQW